MSLNILIFTAKYVIIDVWEVMLLNALTTSLDDFYGWLHMTIYFYSIMINYTRTNFLVEILQKCFFFIFKKKIKSSSLNWKNFNDLISSCVLQGNLIVLFRVATFKVFGHFIIFSKTDQNYIDCTLQENKGVFFIYDRNSWIVCMTHFLSFLDAFFGC